LASVSEANEKAALKKNPFNVFHAISSLSQKKSSLHSLNNTLDKFDYLDFFGNLKTAAWHISQMDLESLKAHLPNVSLPCISQTTIFTQQLEKKAAWALTGY
jgi:hypothetical protein